MNPPKCDETGNLWLLPVGEAVVSDTNWISFDGPLFNSSAFVAVDFETYFSKDYSLETLTPWKYVNHPAFNAYLVALHYWTGEKHWQWVGKPTDAPWEFLISLGIPFVSHNASFDALVYFRCRQLGEIKFPEPDQWHCTADLSSWLQMGRSLKAAAANLLGQDLDKSLRVKMQRGDAQIAEIRSYALLDSQTCAFLWGLESGKWPARERICSLAQRKSNHLGVKVDVPAILAGIETLEGELVKIQGDLPWGFRGPPTSYDLFCSACYQRGIEPPLSLAADSESCRIWEEKYGKEYSWVTLIRSYTQINQMRGSLKMLLDRKRRDDTVPFELVYCRAPHTKRWQHRGGLRIQNLNRNRCAGISLRSMFIPRSGHLFVGADFDQIEPRVLAWLVKDHDFLRRCREGENPYEIHARQTMGFTGSDLKKSDPLLYRLAKVRVLSLGYGAGAEACRVQAKNYGLDLDLEECTYHDPEGGSTVHSKISHRLSDPDFVKLYNEGKLRILPSARQTVRDFRRRSRLITNFWKEMEQKVRQAHGGDLEIPLASGTSLRYFEVEARPSELQAKVVKNSTNPRDKKHLYGGKIVENLVQAYSREVLCDRLYVLEQMGIRLIFSVHDEGLWEVPQEGADNARELIETIMSSSPSWAPDLPLKCEAKLLPHYQ